MPFAAALFAMLTLQMSSLGFSPLLQAIQREFTAFLLHTLPGLPRDATGSFVAGLHFMAAASAVSFLIMLSLRMKQEGSLE